MMTGSLITEPTGSGERLFAFSVFSDEADDADDAAGAETADEAFDEADAEVYDEAVDADEVSEDVGIEDDAAFDDAF